MQGQPTAAIKLCHKVLAMTPDADDLGALEAGDKYLGGQLTENPASLRTTWAIVFRGAFLASTRLKPSTSGNSGIGPFHNHASS
jgi:hypothetical protein